MTQHDQRRYIEAFSKLVGVKEEEVLEYAHRKGLSSLVTNATDLLNTTTQKQKHQAFLELYRMSQEVKNPNPVLNSAESASRFFRSIMDSVHDKEAFAVAILNTKSRVIDYEVVSLGTVNQALVHPREVFRRAIVNKASGIIVCHNHPSGEVTPSQEDRQLTTRLKDAGELLGIRLVDHVIISGLNDRELFSFTANAVLESKTPYEPLQNPPTKDSPPTAPDRETLATITAKLEAGIREVFTGGRFKDYLKTLSKFPSYSFNNTLLIAMQKPDATFVAGYGRWQEQFKRQVRKGERGIRIIAPVPVPVPAPTPSKGEINQDANPSSDDSSQSQSTHRPRFRVISVFDISQTEGEPLPQLAMPLAGDVSNFEVFMAALKKTSPVPIAIEPLSEFTDGYYHDKDKRIVLRQGMSDLQTIAAALHEITHAKLHGELILQPTENAVDKAQAKAKRMMEEVEAESIAYTVCQYYGLETDINSFGYIAAWSKDKELPELKASLERIKDTASSLIEDLNHHFSDIKREHGEKSKPVIGSSKEELRRPSLTTLLKENKTLTEPTKPTAAKAVEMER